MDNCSFLKNISLMFGRKAIVVFLFFSFFHAGLMPDNLVSQDSVKVNKTDSTVTTRSLPKWLLEQKKYQTARKEQPSDIFKSNNYFLFSAMLTVILLFVIVVSVSIIIVKRRSQSFN